MKSDWHAFVVEDDADSLEIMLDELKCMGHVCHSACDVATAQELIRRNAYDYFVLDLEIPNKEDGMTIYSHGIDLLSFIKDKVEAPLIFITSGKIPDKQAALELAEYGRVITFEKPVKFSQLRSRLLIELANRRPVHDDSAIELRLTNADVFFCNQKFFPGSDDRRIILGILCDAKRNGGAKMTGNEIATGLERNYQMKKTIDAGKITREILTIRNEFIKILGLGKSEENTNFIIANDNDGAGYYFTDNVALIDERSSI